MSLGIVKLRPGREKPIHNRHPWIFSGAVADASNARDGELVTIVDHKGRFLARGYWNSKSQIQARILTWRDEPIDDDWWRGQLSKAFQARQPSLQGSSAARLVNAENDFLPGLVIDRYADWLVIQAQTRFIDARKNQIADIAMQLSGARHVFERSDIDLRRMEGLPRSAGLLRGGPLPETVAIDEAARFHVDIARGHKTGFYLDQRDNRRLLLDLVMQTQAAKRLRLLNLFSYSGGFAITAAKAGGVDAVNVDSSRAALELAEHNFVLNGYEDESMDCSAEFVRADAFDYLSYAVEEDERYDIVVLDPPKFAKHKRHIDRAARAYKSLNLKALQLIRDGGWLLTCSCSGAISRDLFQKIVFGALADSGRQAQIVRHLSAAPDHPVALTFPEGEYLKGLLLRVC